MLLFTSQCYEPQSVVPYFPFVEVVSRLIPVVRSRLWYRTLATMAGTASTDAHRRRAWNISRTFTQRRRPAATHVVRFRAG